MPSFERPIAGILDGNIEHQVAALWEALNEKSGPPKIDTSTIEQVLTVAPGERPKIIRDVFNIGDPLAPRFVPRAFAIGFENRVNLLFDLDTMALCAHWEGDFARQLSSGKSWFWEPASRTSPYCGTIHRISRCEKPVAGKGASSMRKESGRWGRLTRYARADVPGFASARPDGAVKIEYTLPFDLGSGTESVAITETFYPIQLAERPKKALFQRFVGRTSSPNSSTCCSVRRPGKRQSRVTRS